MNWLAEALPWLFAMGVLILLSAFFSGSEAALFSLSRPNRKRLARSGVGGRVADSLLQDPDRLLSAILFWNLLINMTYFAIAAILGSRLESDSPYGSSGAIAFTAVTLLTIIFFSEMLPKSFAVLVPVRLSVLISRPLRLAVAVVSPLLPLVSTTNKIVGRLIWPTFEPETDIDLCDIERAIELGTDDAMLQQRDRIALHGLVEMADIRASELMRPRSKLLICSEPIEPNVLADQAPPGGYLMVSDVGKKNVVAAVGVALLRPSQMDDLDGAKEPVIHVPWAAMVSQVWDQLHEEDASVAVVVNEFGEFVGAISTQDILRRVLAPRRGQDDEVRGAASITEIGDDRYRVLGSVSLRRLIKRLQIEAPEENIATVAGFIQRQTERLPRVDDLAILDRYVLKVVEQHDELTWVEVSPLRDDSPDYQREAQS